MFTLEYDGCARLGILKVFWKRKNIENKKKTIIAKLCQICGRPTASVATNHGGKMDSKKIFTYPPNPWNRFELVLAGQREKVYPDGKEIPN